MRNTPSRKRLHLYGQRIALAITLAVGGCASDTRSGEERAKDVALSAGAGADLCGPGPSFLICVPVMAGMGAVIGAIVPYSDSPSYRPPKNTYRPPENTSFSTNMANAAHDGSQAGILKVNKHSINRESSGLVTATLLVDLEASGKDQENSYTIEVGVDCVDGGLEAYRIRSYEEKGGQGRLIHTQLAGIVNRTKPSPPLDTVVRAICNPS